MVARGRKEGRKERVKKFIYRGDGKERRRKQEGNVRKRKRKIRRRRRKNEGK